MLEPEIVTIELGHFKLLKIFFTGKGELVCRRTYFGRENTEQMQGSYYAQQRTRGRWRDHCA